MASQLSVLQSHGIKYNTQAVVDGCARAKVPVWIGGAMLIKETGGANVFGHDPGGAMYGAGEVTQAKFNQFMALINSGHKSNGVGPTQITSKSFFPIAASKGYRLWVPSDNIAFGLSELIAPYLAGSTSDAAIVRAGTRYNGASSYGYSMLAIAKTLRAALGGATESTDFTDDLAHWFTAVQARALQAKVGTAVDGIIGLNTITAVQKAVGVAQDGVVGPLTVKALQKAAGLTGSAVDGDLGPVTAAAVVKWSTPATRPPAKAPAAPKGTAFPLPKGHAYAVNDGTAYTHSGVNKADQPAIKKIQKKVGVTADGIYGPKTKAAVAKAQKSKKVTADGEVGPTTWKALAL